MRILLVSSSSGSRGGGEIFLLYLAEALKSGGHRPMLWCASHSRMDELAERFAEFGEVFRDDYANSYLDRRMRVVSAALDFPTIRRLAHRFAEIDCDLIHLNKQTLEDGLDLLDAVRRSGRRWMGTIHITQTSRSLGAVGARVRDTLALRNLKRAGEGVWTAVSDARGAELRRALPDLRVETVYNAVSEAPGVDRETVRSRLLERLGWSGDCVLAVCVARLVPQKDPERFLELAASLARRDGKMKFLWIGDGPERAAFERGAEAIGLSGKVACSGWTNEPRVFLAAADLYLHPAAYEGLPLAILEAMAAGLPCVLSPAIAAEAEVFKDRAVMVADGVDGIWLDRAACAREREACGTGSRNLYETHFHPASMADAFSQLYQEVVS